MRRVHQFHLQVYFHNFSKYDSCFLIKYAKPNYWSASKTKTKTDNASTNSNEKRNGWKCRTKGNKVAQLENELLDFRDSMDLFPMAIAKLAKNIPDDKLFHVSKEKYPDEEFGKNIYPYEHIDSVSKFKNKKFPSIKHFESSI